MARLIYYGPSDIILSEAYVLGQMQVFVAIQQQTPREVWSRQKLAHAYSREGWICNRGVFGWRMSFDVDEPQRQCFCPPSYFGDWCEFMSDRITVFTHFEDQSGYLSKGVIKILALLVLILNDTTTIRDHHEFSFIPALGNLDEKHKFYLVYPRPHELRSNVARYAVRFEAYHLNDDETIDFLAAWFYAVPFNFLPSQRLAKVLKYSRRARLKTNHMCLSNNSLCLNGGKCHPFMNKLTDTQSYWCECESGLHGPHCEFKDQLCLISTTTL